MARSSTNIDVYVEIGKKRKVDGALDWPGWCRIGRDEAGALQALADAGPRYARVGHAAQLAFQPPPDVSAFAVVERLAGTATTDFGVPDVAPSGDARPVDDADQRRFQALLQACWGAFDRAVEAASGEELRKGPRGGGRDLDGIIRHVLGAEASYVARLARKVEPREAEDVRAALGRTRRAARCRRAGPAAG